METVIEMLFALRLKGAELWLENGTLRCRAPPGALSPDDYRALKDRRLEIVDLLQQASTESTREPPLLPRLLSEDIPLAPVQYFFFNHIAADKGRTFYDPIIMTRLLGNLDVKALEQSAVDIVRRHEALRMRIRMQHGVPSQVVAQCSYYHLKHIYLEGSSLSEAEAEAKRTILQLTRTPLELVESPLFATYLIHLTPGAHIFVVLMHHILFDGPSIDILLRDIPALYAQASKNQPSSLPNISIQYADHIVWQKKFLDLRSPMIEKYWTNRLLGAKYPRVFQTEMRTDAGSQIGIVPFNVDQQLLASLKDISSRNAVSIMMSILTVYAATLLHWCNTTELVIEVPAISRRYPEVINTVGQFATVLFLRLEVRGDDSCLDLLNCVVSEYSRAYEHHDSGKLWGLQPKCSLPSSPVFSFNTGEFASFLDPASTWSSDTDPKGNCVSASPFPVEVPPRDYDPTALYSVEELDLTMSLDAPSRLSGTFYYRADRVERSTIDGFLVSFISFARLLAKHPTRKIFFDRLDRFFTPTIE